MKNALPIMLFAALLGLSSAAVAADFTIESPAQGAVLSSPVTLRIAVQDSQIGYPLDGFDHLHASLDGGPEVALYKNEPRDIQVSPGVHTIWVELAGPTHAPRMAPKTTTFTVK